MIDEEKTFREKGYYSTDLSFGSGKEVWAVCEGESCERVGGRGRWVCFKDYRDLCMSCAAKNRPMKKYETNNEKLPWVDDEITFAEKGYRSTWLKRGSAKPVWAICANPDCEREGGRGRWVKFYAYRELCHLCAHKTDEIRMKNSKANKGKNLGEKNHSWKGGVSFDPYCHKFNDKFKEEVREKFGRLCFLCDKDDEENGRRLDVHHVNYDKECMCNEVECEFVPLCRKCHGMTGVDRELWRRMILNQLAMEGWI